MTDRLTNLHLKEFGVSKVTQDKRISLIIIVDNYVLLELHGIMRPSSCIYRKPTNERMKLKKKKKSAVFLKNIVLIAKNMKNIILRVCFLIVCENDLEIMKH